MWVEGVGFIPPIFEAPQDLQNHPNPLEVSSNWPTWDWSSWFLPQDTGQTPESMNSSQLLVLISELLVIKCDKYIVDWWFQHASTIFNHFNPPFQIFSVVPGDQHPPTVVQWISRQPAPLHLHLIQGLPDLGRGASQIIQIRDGERTSKSPWIPSGNLLHSYWKWPFIMDLPIENGDFP